MDGTSMKNASSTELSQSVLNDKATEQPEGSSLEKEHALRLYSWIVLLILLTVQISNQWQRFMISTAYYFIPNDDHSDPQKYEITAAIPHFTDARYGYVAGPLFYLCFGTLVLFTGSFADNFSRRYLLGIAAVLWSLTSLGMAFSSTFTEICAFRLLLGTFESFCPSAAYSLITDYFPPEIRTTANACFAGCIFVGASLSSLSILMIGSVGWRESYGILAVYGVICGLLVIFVVKEPVRGRFDQNSNRP